MTKRFLFNLKAKKKIMKLPMTALVSAVAIYGGTLLYSVSAMKRPAEEVIERTTKRSNIGEQDELINLHSFNEVMLERLFKGLPVESFKDVKFKVFIGQGKMEQVRKYLPKEIAVKIDPSNEDIVIIGEEEKPEGIPKMLKERYKIEKANVDRMLPDAQHADEHAGKIGSVKAPIARKKIPKECALWQEKIYSVLGLKPEVGCFKDTRSKTIYFIDPKEQIRKICIRQYVLYIEEAKVASECADLFKNIYEFVKNSGKSFKVIGIWRAACRENELYILVDRDDLARKRSGFRAEAVEYDPGAFEVVGLFRKGEKDNILISNKNEIFAKLKPYLDILEDPSIPPKITYTRKDWECRVPYSCLIFENAKAAWRLLFSPQTAVVSKDRFRVTISFPDSFSDLTRLQHFVDREDWLKFAVFFSPTFKSITTSLAENKTEFDEAKELTEEGILAFKTFSDEYNFEEAPKNIGIVPAYRFWRYGFYVLYVRKDGVVHRFFLAKHCKHDECLMYYNPYADEIGLYTLLKDRWLQEKFFYIVPYEPKSYDDGDSLPYFTSLKDVKYRICSKVYSVTVDKV